VSQAKVSLYYKNVTAARIGDEHGISEGRFEELAGKAAAAVEKVNEERRAGKTPYRELPYKEEYARQAKEAAAEVAGKCDVFVVLGIGGSALGNIALQTALSPAMYNLDEKQRRGPQFFVFDNVDPVQFGSLLEYIEDRLDRTYFNVVSKSGETAETAAQFLIVRKKLMERYGAAGVKERIIATTDAAGGTMRRITNEEGYRSLVVPEGVGGRFSVLSPVGLLSAAVCGIDVDGLLAGARAMDERVKTTEMRRNPAAINAAIQWHYYQQGKKISVMMPYSDSLKDLADWYRQLWAESLGRRGGWTGRRFLWGRRR